MLRLRFSASSMILGIVLFGCGGDGSSSDAPDGGDAGGPSRKADVGASNDAGARGDVVGHGGEESGRDGADDDGPHDAANSDDDAADGSMDSLAEVSIDGAMKDAAPFDGSADDALSIDAPAA